MYQVSEIMITTARKDRKCNFCPILIKAGEKYQAIHFKDAQGFRRQKSYHFDCFDKHEKMLHESNVAALRDMSPSARNLLKIRSDNE